MNNLRWLNKNNRKSVFIVVTIVFVAVIFALFLYNFSSFFYLSPSLFHLIFQFHFFDLRPNLWLSIMKWYFRKLFDNQPIHFFSGNNSCVWEVKLSSYTLDFIYRYSWIYYSSSWMMMLIQNIYFSRRNSKIAGLRSKRVRSPIALLLSFSDKLNFLILPDMV